MRAVNYWGKAHWWRYVCHRLARMMSQKEGLSLTKNKRVKCSAIEMSRRPATNYSGGIDLDAEGGSPVRMTKSISRCGESNEDPNNRQEHLGPMLVRRLARQSSAS